MPAGKGIGIAAKASKSIRLSRARFGHTFREHGSQMTEQLTYRAINTGKPQGQFLDDQLAARFIQDNLHLTRNGAVSVRVPNDFPARVILPDGSYVRPSTIRLVPGGKGVKTACLEP